MMIHLPLDVEDFRGGMATCGVTVTAESMGVLALSPGHWTGREGRRVDCPGCLAQTLEGARKLNNERRLSRQG